MVLFYVLDFGSTRRGKDMKEVEKGGEEKRGEERRSSLVVFQLRG